MFAISRLNKTLDTRRDLVDAAIHSYSVSLREALKDKVEVIEVAPPAVQTGLTLGQETREGYQPLAAFMDEVMTQYASYLRTTSLTTASIQT